MIGKPAIRRSICTRKGKQDQELHERSQLFIRSHNEALSVAMRVYEVRPGKDKRGVDLICGVLPFRSAVVWRSECCRQCNRDMRNSTAGHMML